MQTATEASESDPIAEQVAQDQPEPGPQPGDEEWFAKLEHYLAEAGDEESVDMVWSELDVDSELSATTPEIVERAAKVREHHLARVKGQGDMFPGDLPADTQAALKLGNTP